ncbi:MAG TPA: cation-transporting P-type ATPase, partial [Blastocatellia bacterium]|nr:cation-transporting P-type ATPase [Blastocatellia bacterium]
MTTDSLSKRVVKAFEQSKPASRGLSSAEAKRLLSEHGSNELTDARRAGNVFQILRLFANPLVIILLIASLVSWLLGERVNASIIVLMVLLSVALNFFQTYRSERAAERLRQQVAPTATVLRDGEWTEVHRRDLVPG